MQQNSANLQKMAGGSNVNNVSRRLFEENLSSSEEDPFADSGSDFVPSEEDVSSESENEYDNQVPMPVRRAPEESPDKSPAKRKRKSHIENRKKTKAKRRRNSGKQYMNVKKNVVAGRVIGQLCNCKLNCPRKLTLEVQQEIFNGFWNLGNFDKQNSYLFGNIRSVGIKRRYGQAKANPEQSRKQHTFFYYVKISGIDVRLCKQSFMAVHGLQNNRGRIFNVLKMIKTSSSPRLDKRGKHNTRPNKVSDHIVEGVRSHINSIPKYQSHYSRHENPLKVYLGCEMTIAKLYEESYISFCTQNNIEPVSKDKYRRIFCEEYNIGFQLPKSDTCQTCDKLQISIQDAMLNNRDCQANQVEKELHIRRAEAMQQHLKNMTQLAKDSPDLVHVISVDLQQTLPTPKLTCGPAFYLRKLWTYNVGIHDCGGNRGYMFTWDESIAGRGSDEIGSCIRKYLELKNIPSKKLVIFSDNCGGQNKNWSIVSLWHYLINTGPFEEIEHSFLIPGHTHLPSDRDFAKIEKYHRNHHLQVYTPDEWKTIISKSQKSTPFIVTDMMQTDFYVISNLKKKITQRQQSIEGHPIEFSKIRVFKFTKQDPDIMLIKHNTNSDLFAKVNLRKKGKTEKYDKNFKFDLKYKDTKLISEKKLKDIQALLPYIPPVFHPFYRSLKASGATVDDNMPENVDGNEDA